MKLKDCRIGMKVVDKLGNEYEVLEADDTIRPLKLKCIKFVREAKLAPFASFAEVGGRGMSTAYTNNFIIKC